MLSWFPKATEPFLLLPVGGTFPEPSLGGPESSWGSGLCWKGCWAGTSETADSSKWNGQKSPGENGSYCFQSKQLPCEFCGILRSGTQVLLLAKREQQRLSVGLSGWGRRSTFANWHGSLQTSSSDSVSHPQGSRLILGLVKSCTGN